MPRLSKVGAAALAAFGWTGLSSVSASYLVVAGGGGGGQTNGEAGGGGGAGGFRTGTSSLNPTLSYTITVGAGGAKGTVSPSNNGSNGSDSVFNTITSSGGGKQATAGGSGGGGQSVNANQGAGNTPSTSPSQGNSGGGGNGGYFNGGGGGGAGSAGSISTATLGGAGGSGSASIISGTSVTYAGGGGGGGYTYNGGAGGSGGGGNGGTVPGAGQAGGTNLGGGGGAGSMNPGTNQDGGNGGSGIVIISYPAPQQFGGGVVTTSGSNVIHTFTTSGTLSPLSSLTASYLVVAGGGSGASGTGGGGGAGGYRTGSAVIDTNSIYTVIVGAGGAATTYGYGSAAPSGTSSVFFNTTSAGGGGGTAGQNGGGFASGAAGGSGGGGGYNSVGGAGNTPSVSPSQGNNGGNADGTDAPPYAYPSGGGGGASAAGGSFSGVQGNPGAGGAGTANSISGSSVTYAGGGGGCSTTVAASGGAGGGGAGAISTTNGVSGTANTGGGGGGARNSTNTSSCFGGAGGSGVVIISYAGSTQLMAGGTVTITGGNVIHTFTSSGYLTPIKLINNSLRFRASVSAYLSRTPSVAGNQKTWTFSAWIKMSLIANDRIIFSGGTSNPLSLYRNNSGNLVVDVAGVGTYQTSSAVYRDPAAWYHIVWAFDTTQATAANRSILYVNGSAISLTQNSTFTQNTNYNINNATLQTIGIYAHYLADYFFDGYLTEVNFINGQQLTPNSFGTFNSYGVWQPITYGGSYGTNGFYLPFTNNTSATTLGYDFSPNGNNWTPNNISGTSAVSTIRRFTSSTAWTAPAGVTSVNYLVVGGGGGGYIAGGGAGGYRTGTLFVTPGTQYTVTVGAGGPAGSNGDNSVFGSITSLGGGGQNATGGSGGGGEYNSTPGGSGTAGQGNNGGAGSSNAGGGGGGAGSAGSNAPSAHNGGNGGSGLTVSSVLGGGTYAGGGGGGATTVGGSVPGTGGSGGGGNGSRTSTPGGNGTVNTGGGSGGNASGLAAGGTGGSGIVIISYSQDSMTDVPTLTSATAANYATWNPLDGAGSQTTYSNGNLEATVSGNPAIAFTTMATPTTGKWYCEFTVGGAAQVGGDWMIGISDSSKSLTERNWAGASGWFLYSEGTKYNNGNGVGGWSVPYTSGDIIGVAVDLDGGTLSFYKNGTNLGVAYNTGIAGKSMMFALGTGTGSLSQYQAARINCGQLPFIYTPPSGHVGLNTYNL